MDNLGDGNGGPYNKNDSNKTDLNNTDSKTYIHDSKNRGDDDFYSLYDIDNNFVKSYLAIMSNYRPEHKKVSKDNINFIVDALEYIESEDVDISLWEESILDYFSKLPKNNDGAIMAFLKASMRYFGIDIVYEFGR